MPAAARIAGWLAGTLVCALAAGALGAAEYAERLGWADAGLDGSAQRWIVALIGSQVVWLLAGPLVLAALLALAGRVRTAQLLALAAAAATCAWLGADLLVWRLTGNPLSVYAPMAFADGGVAMAGGAGITGSLGRQAGCAAVIGAALFEGTACLVRRRAATFRIVGAAALLAGAVGCASALRAPRDALLHIETRTALQLGESIALPLITPADVMPEDEGGPWAALNLWLDAAGPQIERRATAAAKLLPVFDLPAPAKAPTQVLFIIAESLRADALDPARMPRLSEWSRRGLRLERHYSASNASQYGLFSALYGREPMTYESTLDAARPSSLAESLRRSGHRRHLFCSVSMKWKRMDEFLNDRNFDTVDCDEKESWVEGDRRSLERATGLLVEKAGHFVVVHLNSSHFPYRYPDEYERSRPVAPLSMEWADFQSAGERDEAFKRSWTNRYDNSLAFLDDRIADLLDAVDLERTLVVVTGDHGESFRDDGFWAHGSRMSEAQLRVPAFVVGAGVPPMTLSAPTQHIDLVPTLLGALGVSEGQLEALPGLDLRRADAAALEARPLLFSNAAVDYLAVLSRGERMLLWRSPAEQALDAIGLMDADGGYVSRDQLPRESTEAWVESLRRAFRATAL